MATYNLTDANGNSQRIKAASMFQARIALAEINESNGRQSDGGRKLAASWRNGSAKTGCVEGTRGVWPA